ncbi:MAG: protein kinase domain-containing protein, partial [Candidatus Xenobia bacterium]
MSVHPVQHDEVNGEAGLCQRALDQAVHDVEAELSHSDANSAGAGAVPAVIPGVQCPNCGEANPDDVLRCQGCFTYMGPLDRFGVQEEEVRARFCPRCGKKNPVGAPTCERCERNLAEFIPLATIIDGRFIALADWASVRLAGHLAVDMQQEDLCNVRVGIFNQYEDDEAREAAVRKVALARTFEHPTIVPVRAFSAETKSGYVVFEHVRGRDLESVLADEGHPWFDETRVLRIADQLLSALEYIQSRRPVVQLLDLSPEHLMVGPGGKIHLLPLDAQAWTPTPGRLPYRAPETFWGVPVPASDIFTLSALLHHLLTGEAPISRSAWDFPPLRGYQPELSETLEAIVARGLRGHPDERYFSAAYMYADLAVAYPKVFHGTSHTEAVVVESWRVHPESAAPRPAR